MASLFGDYDKRRLRWLYVLASAPPVAKVISLNIFATKIFFQYDP